MTRKAAVYWIHVQSWCSLRISPSHEFWAKGDMHLSRLLLEDDGESWRPWNFFDYTESNREPSPHSETHDVRTQLEVAGISAPKTA